MLVRSGFKEILLGVNVMRGTEGGVSEYIILLIKVKNENIEECESKRRKQNSKQERGGGYDQSGNIGE